MSSVPSSEWPRRGAVARGRVGGVPVERRGGRIEVGRVGLGAIARGAAVGGLARIAGEKNEHHRESGEQPHRSTIDGLVGWAYRPGGARGPESRACTPILLYYNISVRFDWDSEKSARNLEKHGVSFEDAQTAFDDALGAYYPDTLHDARFILIGHSRSRRLLYVVHAEVGIDAIRIISARKATTHEREHYEND